MTTADQREQALAAFERLADRGAWAGPGTQYHADLALVRAFIGAAPLPADLAAVQERADDYATATRLRIEASPDDAPRRIGQWDGAAHDSAADVPALVAELTEWRARAAETTEEWAAQDDDGTFIMGDPPTHGEAVTIAGEMDGAPLFRRLVNIGPWEAQR